MGTHAACSSATFRTACRCSLSTFSHPSTPLLICHVVGDGCDGKKKVETSACRGGEKNSSHKLGRRRGDGVRQDWSGIQQQVFISRTLQSGSFSVFIHIHLNVGRRQRKFKLLPKNLLPALLPFAHCSQRRVTLKDGHDSRPAIGITTSNI